MMNTTMNTYYNVVFHNDDEYKKDIINYRETEEED